jgi:hypothetical protein
MLLTNWDPDAEYIVLYGTLNILYSMALLRLATHLFVTPADAAECGSTVSSVRLYRDHATIMGVQFNYKDGQSSTTGVVTDLYDEFELGSNECFVKIEQYMDLGHADGGHKRRVVLSTSSGRTFQTTPVFPETPNGAPVVLQAPSGQCITNAEGGGAPNPLTEASYSPCSGVAASLSLSLSLSLARSLALESCRSHLTKRYGSLCCQPLHRPRRHLQVS